MVTVTQLARSCGLSRSTLLYYESIGLIAPAARTVGNYRCYGERERFRLEQICAYRRAGLKLDDIRALLDPRGGQAYRVLRGRLVEIDAEIAALRSHQQSILKLLGHKALRKDQCMTKDKWVSILSGSGFTEEQMWNWHTEFERAAPDEHQLFLEYLHIAPEEIVSIRLRSRPGENNESRPLL